MNLIPDSLPALSVAAAYAQGDTHFTSLAHVRVKETDRVAVMQEVLCACGADVEITADSMTVHGGKPLTGTQVSSHDDHRVAMAMAVCGLLADGEMKISDPECAAVSFPGFYESMNKIGAGFVLK
jgi:3-phosphoshikimate 1-carboxyvinyltransferase